MKYMRRTAGYIWTHYKTNAQIAKELKITPILDKFLEYKRNWIQHVNRMPRNRLPRVMKRYSPTRRRNHGRPLKRLLDTWDRNGSTSGPTPWQIYDDDAFMQSICTYTSETKLVSRVEFVAAALLLQFTVNVMLFPVFNLLFFPQYVFSAQYGCFLYLPDFVFLKYVAQLLSEWFEDGSIYPYYYWHHFSFCIPHALCFCCKVSNTIIMCYIVFLFIQGLNIVDGCTTGE